MLHIVPPSAIQNSFSMCPCNMPTSSWSCFCFGGPPSLSCTPQCSRFICFRCPCLESVSSPRVLSCFCWRMVFKMVLSKCHQLIAFNIDFRSVLQESLCYRLKVPLQIHMLKSLTPQCDAHRRWGLWMVLHSECLCLPQNSQIEILMPLRCY